VTLPQLIRVLRFLASELEGPRPGLATEELYAILKGLVAELESNGVETSTPIRDTRAAISRALEQWDRRPRT
jgi:hypothetical protein